MCNIHTVYCKSESVKRQLLCLVKQKQVIELLPRDLSVENERPFPVDTSDILSTCLRHLLKINTIVTRKVTQKSVVGDIVHIPPNSYCYNIIYYTTSTNIIDNSLARYSH